MREDWFIKRQRKLAQLNEAEAAGRVADSMDVRMELVRKMRAGDMTLEDVQAELKRIKRNAKKNGQITRDQAYRGR